MGKSSLYRFLRIVFSFYRRLNGRWLNGRRLDGRRQTGPGRLQGFCVLAVLADAVVIVESAGLAFVLDLLGEVVDRLDLDLVAG